MADWQRKLAGPHMTVGTTARAQRKFARAKQCWRSSAVLVPLVVGVVVLLSVANNGFVTAPGLQKQKPERLDGEVGASRRDSLLLGGAALLAGLGLHEDAASAGDEQTGMDAAMRAAAAMEGSEICGRCCDFDWCQCSTLPVLFPQVTSCDCLAHFKAQGYQVPLDARAAYATAGKTAWPAALGTQTANFPRWNIVAEEDLKVKTSSFPDAGKGLFTNIQLQPGTVMPPYKGSFMTGTEVKGRDKASSDMVWCPVAYMLSQEDAENEPNLCVDAKPAAEQNPSRFINAASKKSQCQAVNLEQCEIGQVMYYRTTRSVPAGAELATDYGMGYWNDFDGCLQAQ